MRFMMITKERTRSGSDTPDAESAATMMKYMESLQKAGVLLAFDGLRSPRLGAYVSFPGGKAVVSDGPFAEAKEVIGGYWIIQVKSKEEAIEWTRRCPAFPDFAIEIRQVMEFSDFPADVQAVMPGFPQLHSGHPAA